MSEFDGLLLGLLMILYVSYLITTHYNIVVANRVRVLEDRVDELGAIDKGTNLGPRG